MKIAKLFHNPRAGDEDHSEEKLVSIIEKEGYKCRYSSTKKKGWKKIEDDTEFIIIAGGDGTVKKVAKEILNRKKLARRWPLGLLPLGTANNIAKTLELKDVDIKKLVKSWSLGRMKKFDVGRLTGGEESMFFLESFGYGIFPYLMMEMKKIDEDEFPDPELKIKKALEVLHTIIIDYEPRICKLEVDGTDHSGEFLLAEVMNTRTLGPSLCLSPLGDPGDGEMEVVLVPKDHKDKFAEFVLNRMKGNEEQYLFHTLKGKNITISWQGTHVHVDDSIIELKEAEKMKVELLPGLLEFFLPAAEATKPD